MTTNGEGAPGEGRDRFRDKIDAMEARIRELKEKAREAEAELRARLGSQESSLRERMDETLARLRDVREASEEGWEEVKAGAERLWADMREAWERTAAAGEAEDAEPAGPDAAENDERQPTA